MPVHAVSGARASSARAKPCAASAAGSASGEAVSMPPSIDSRSAAPIDSSASVSNTVGLTIMPTSPPRNASRGRSCPASSCRLWPSSSSSSLADAGPIQEDIRQSPLLGLIVECHDQISNRVRRRDLGRAERHRACLRRYRSDPSQRRNEHTEPEENGEGHAAHLGRPRSDAENQSGNGEFGAWGHLFPYRARSLRAIFNCF